MSINDESDRETLTSSYIRQCFFGLLCAALVVHSATAAEVAGVKVKLVDYSGPATFSVEATAQYALQINIDPQAEPREFNLQVELPIAGPQAWPVVDVAVFDTEGREVSARRGGIEWHKLLITVPPKRTTFVVKAVNPTGSRPSLRSEKERHATDAKTGLRASICRWYGGRRAALSIRFDDSHSTHLSKAIPILNEHGFRGTFMVNPGGLPANSRRRSAFQEHRAEWEAVARRGNHEFANHTMHHRGANDDEAMEHEIGEAAKAIWRLFPQKGKLAALNLGGGTQWVSKKPLRYYLDKYHLFDASANSTGMDDSYGGRIATFRRLLQGHIERGLWYKVHYHYIGDGLSTSEANFRAALRIAKAHQDELWIAGMADIHKYQIERRGAKLEIENRGPRQTILRLVCTTKPELYDQPLTLDITLPKSWATRQVVVNSRKVQPLDTRKVTTSDGVVLRCDVRPIDGEYTIETTLLPN